MSSYLRVHYDAATETRQEFAARVLLIAAGREVTRDSGAASLAYLIAPAADGSLPDAAAYPGPAARGGIVAAPLVAAGSVTPCGGAAPVKKAAKKAAKKATPPATEQE